MKRGIKILSIMLLAVCLCVTSTTAYASQESIDKMKEEKEQTQNEKDGLQKKKDEAAGVKKELENVSKDLNSKIENLNGQISTVAGEITESEEKISSTQADIDELTKEIDAAQKICDEQYASMKVRVQYMYENGSRDWVSSLFNVGSISGFLTKLEYISSVSSYDKNMMEEYEKNHSILVAKSEELEDKKAELTGYQDQLKSKKSQLGTLVASTSDMLKTTDSQIDAVQDMMDDYDAQIKAAEQKEKSLAEAILKAQIELAESMSGDTGKNDGDYTSTDEDVLLLAAIIQAEADNQGVDGRDAVGSVVMNRVYSGKFPNTIAGVIYQKNQFAPVASGRLGLILAQGPNKNCIASAEKVIAGYSRTNALFFTQYSYAQNLHNQQVAAGQVGFLDRTAGEVILAHYFYNYK